ncbi:MAG: synthase [Firmicutes bacterium]|nr:synthase [Bacillota bacterium]
MKTCLIGSYPKIPAGSGPSVRRALQQFEKGQIGPRELENVYQAVTETVLHLAEAAGLDRTTDGLIHWNDELDAVVRDIDNLNAAGLLRYFNNNFYYRHPIISGRLQFQGGVAARWATQAAKVSSVPLVAVLPGPFTLAALAEDTSYQDFDTLLADLVEVLRLEADSLATTGVVEVQWNEPALAVHAARYPVAMVQQALTNLIADAPLPQSLALYFGHSSPWLDVLSTVPFARVLADAVSDPSVLQILERDVMPWSVGVGLIDARNVRMEDADAVVQALEPILMKQGTDHVWLHPSCGLEFLPPDRAEQKVRVLTQIANRVRGQAAPSHRKDA